MARGSCDRECGGECGGGASRAEQSSRRAQALKVRGIREEGSMRVGCVDFERADLFVRVLFISFRWTDGAHATSSAIAPAAFPNGTAAHSLPRVISSDAPVPCAGRAACLAIFRRALCHALPLPQPLVLRHGSSLPSARCNPGHSCGTALSGRVSLSRPSLSQSKLSSHAAPRPSPSDKRSHPLDHPHALRPMSPSMIMLYSDYDTPASSPSYRSYNQSCPPFSQPLPASSSACTALSRSSSYPPQPAVPLVRRTRLLRFLHPRERPPSAPSPSARPGRPSLRTEMF
ncbi:hypothetical protein BV20DRAFT_633945 [Pilatotrama ljubarskyi]|nr:hypothetical protein BV20DRAFT_633945 [Pilatotrama ljubarskyi]